MSRFTVTILLGLLAAAVLAGFAFGGGRGSGSSYQPMWPKRAALQVAHAKYVADNALECPSHSQPGPPHAGQL
jgi:hypothetical protein